jgi:hypothetical protein
MAEPMAVQVEIWPVAADAAGVWLLSGDDAWRPELAVPSDSEPHAEVELALAQHGTLNDVVLSTRRPGVRTGPRSFSATSRLPVAWASSSTIGRARGRSALAWPRQLANRRLTPLRRHQPRATWMCSCMPCVISGS